MASALIIIVGGDLSAAQRNEIMMSYGDVRVRFCHGAIPGGIEDPEDVARKFADHLSHYSPEDHICVVFNRVEKAQVKGKMQIPGISIQRHIEACIGSGYRVFVCTIEGVLTERLAIPIPSTDLLET